MTAILRFLALACVFALGIPTMGGAQKVGEKDEKKADLSAAVRAALRLEGKAQIKQLAALTQDYADLEGELIHEFRNATPVEKKCAVAFLMGWYRSTVCVPDLAAFVTLKYESTEPNDRIPLWGEYPAVEALVRINKPAVGPMIRNIETGKDKEFRRLSTEVLLQIEGAEVGRFILESELKKAKVETGRKRFQEALDYLAKAKG